LVLPLVDPPLPGALESISVVRFVAIGTASLCPFWLIVAFPGGTQGHGCPKRGKREDLRDGDRLALLALMDNEVGGGLIAEAHGQLTHLVGVVMT
jgi:hypothetical protein